MEMPVGAASRSITIRVFNDLGLAVTGKHATDFPPIFFSRFGPYADVQIILTDLITITDSYLSGGIKEYDSGRYRLDIPDMIGATEGIYTIYGEATNFHVITDTIEVQSELAILQAVYNSLALLIQLLQGNPNAVSSGVGLLDALQRKRNTQNYTIVSGEAYDLNLVMNPVTDITGWNFTYTLKDDKDNVIITKTTAGGGIVTMNAAGGLIKVVTSAALNNLSPSLYDYDIWRTDSGFENQIAFGKVKIEHRVKV